MGVACACAARLLARDDAVGWFRREKLVEEGIAPAVAVVVTTCGDAGRCPLPLCAERVERMCDWCDIVACATPVREPYELEASSECARARKERVG